MPFDFDKVIKEDSFAQIMCVVTEGDEPFNIAWSLHGHNLTSDLGITTSNIGGRTSLLMIPKVNYKHMGNYTCKASNKAGSVSHTASLKVNGTHRFQLLRKDEKDRNLGLMGVFLCTCRTT